MKELNFKPQKNGLIVNRVPDGKLDAGTLEEIRNQGLELLGVIPNQIIFLFTQSSNFQSSNSQS